MLLDREGIFKAMPKSWGIQKSRDSQSVAIWIEFLVVGKLEGNDWEDWTVYQELTITGYFYIVKRDGAINTITVENLSESLLWNGDLNALFGEPPSIVCQITVENEEFQGKTRLKVKWLNPSDYVPGPKTETPEELMAVDAIYGPRLKALAGSFLKDLPKRDSKEDKGSKPVPPVPSVPKDDLPF